MFKKGYDLLIEWLCELFNICVKIPSLSDDQNNDFFSLVRKKMSRVKAKTIEVTMRHWEGVWQNSV